MQFVRIIAVASLAALGIACVSNGASQEEDADATGGEKGEGGAGEGGAGEGGADGDRRGGAAGRSDAGAGGHAQAGAGGQANAGGQGNGAGGSVATGQAILYPGPAGISASNRYEVLVNGKPSFVYQSQSQLGGGDNASWTNFAFAGGAVTIEVRRLTGAAPQNVIVRPLRQTVAATIKGNGAVFSLSAPAKLSVEFDDDLLNKLFIFADAPEVDPPKQGDPGVLYFGPGVHDVGADFVIPSGGTMYVAGGALVRGTFTADGRSNIKVTGRGILSSRSFGHVDGAGQFKLRNITNGIIDGVTLIESPGFVLTGFSSKNMQYRNLKIIAWYMNTDGIHTGHSATVDDVFVMNHDDCMIVGQYSEDIKISNVVLWNTQSAALQISWVAARGQNVRVKGVDVIHYQAKPSSISGAIGMRHGGSGNLTNFVFEDVVVEHFGPGSHRTFVYLEITPSVYAMGGELGSLSNVLFKDVKVLDSTMNNRIIGRDANHMITDVTFQNLMVDGKVALNAESARIAVNQYTRNIRFTAGP
jgi:hypothetical protein